MKEYQKIGIRVVYFKEQDIIVDSLGIDFEDHQKDWN